MFVVGVHMIHERFRLTQVLFLLSSEHASCNERKESEGAYLWGLATVLLCQC